MYDGNHLAQILRAASVGREAAIFATVDNTGEQVSYGKFFAQAERAASALAALGVRPGDRVAIQAEKSLDALALYIGTVLAGAVFLPLNPAHISTETGYFLKDAGPALFVCDPARLAELSPVAKAAGVKDIRTLAADGSGTLTDMVNAQPPGFPGVARAPEDAAAILYTSGTTGRAKGAVLSHRALASNSLTLCDVWQFTPADTLIHALPIFHTHGLFVATNVTLMSGASMIFMAGFNAARILAAMPRATALMGVPTFYVRLLEAGVSREATDGMRLFISGSAPLLADTHRRWQAATGHAIVERYGMTETSMNTSNPCVGERRAGTVGVALPGVQVIVSDPDTGQERAIGEPGIIEIRGPNLFSGYWRMPEKTAEELRENGFFVTGDIGVLDKDGYLSIIGRARDVIISGGLNIYPKEIEVLIDAIPGVAESAVIGAPHPDFGEAVVAIVVPEPPANPTEAAILRTLAPGLARYKLPKRVGFAKTLPRNAMGKVQKNVLREEYAEIFGQTGEADGV